MKFFLSVAMLAAMSAVGFAQPTPRQIVGQYSKVEVLDLKISSYAKVWDPPLYADYHLSHLQTKGGSLPVETSYGHAINLAASGGDRTIITKAANHPAPEETTTVSLSSWWAATNPDYGSGPGTEIMSNSFFLRLKAPEVGGLDEHSWKGKSEGEFTQWRKFQKGTTNADIHMRIRLSLEHSNYLDCNYRWNLPDGQYITATIDPQDNWLNPPKKWHIKAYLATNPGGLPSLVETDEHDLDDEPFDFWYTENQTVDYQISTSGEGLIDYTQNIVNDNGDYEEFDDSLIPVHGSLVYVGSSQ